MEPKNINKILKTVGGALALFGVAATEVHAQTPVVSFSSQGDQYPSLVEMSGVLTIGTEGTKFNLTCGYDIDNGTVKANPTGNEITFQNMPGLVPGKSQADRFMAIETIDNVPVLTSLVAFSDNPQVATIEAVKNGIPKTVNCNTSDSATTVTECRKTSTLLVNPADMNRMEDLFASKCPEIIKKVAGNPNFNRSLYSREKTEAFVKTKRQKLFAVEKRSITLTAPRPRSRITHALACVKLGKT